MSNVFRLNAGGHQGPGKVPVQKPDRVFKPHTLGRLHRQTRSSTPGTHRNCGFEDRDGASPDGTNARQSGRTRSKNHEHRRSTTGPRCTNLERTVTCVSAGHRLNDIARPKDSNPNLLTLLCLSRAGWRCHRLVELPVELAGDVSLKTPADFPWRLPCAVRRCT